MVKRKLTIKEKKYFKRGLWAVAVLGLLFFIFRMLERKGVDEPPAPVPTWYKLQNFFLVAALVSLLVVGLLFFWLGPIWLAIIESIALVAIVAFIIRKVVSVPFFTPNQPELTAQKRQAVADAPRPGDDVTDAIIDLTQGGNTIKDFEPGYGPPANSPVVT